MNILYDKKYLKHADNTTAKPVPADPAAPTAAEQTTITA